MDADPLHTVAHLRAHGLGHLCAAFRLLARRHTEHPNLVQLRYDQINSPMAEPVVQECRGLILDQADDWRVVAFPYAKFFNYGEPCAAPVDWPTARVLEKLDGSLMTLYPYAGRWHVASSGLPDALGNLPRRAGTFADLFWQTFRGLGYALPPVDAQACYMFELMTPHNQVVCRHPEPRLVLHGVRDLRTLAERDPEPVAAEGGWACVRSHPLATLADCLAAAQAIDPLYGEGFVVRDAAFRRVKVKSPRYVALAHVKDSFSARRLMEVIRTNESAEFLTYFPDLREPYARVGAVFAALCAQVDADYAEYRPISDRRAFAAAAGKTRCPAALFALRDAKADSAGAFFAMVTAQALDRVLDGDPAWPALCLEIDSSVPARRAG